MHSGGSSGPTLQQQQLQAEQALTNANLNLEENSQRKSILNAMQGTRVFRESALSRAVRGNTAGSATPAPGPSPTQLRNSEGPIAAPTRSLLDRSTRGAGATPAGGTGASGATTEAEEAVLAGGNPGGRFKGGR